MKRWVLVSAVGLGTAAACGPTTRNPAAQRYAETYCRAVERCECVERFASTDACIDGIADRAQAELDRGLEVDEECFDAVIESLSGASCDPLIFGPDGGYCISFRGSRKQGETCMTEASSGEPLWPLTRYDCAEGLLCREGVCTTGTVPSPKETMDPCTGGFDACYAGLEDPPLICGYDHVCVEQVQLGEACQDYGCDDGDAYCAGAHGTATGTCTLQSAVGEPCDPLDWDACATPDDTEMTAYCDPRSRTCVLGGSLCRAVNYPYVWRDADG